MVRRQVNHKTIDGFKVVSQCHDEGGHLRLTVICKVCGKEFNRSFSALNKYKTKNCGCINTYLKPLPEFINGFRIIKCHGYDKKRRIRLATVECKICKRIYEVNPISLNFYKSCGCVRNGSIVSRYRGSHPRLMFIYDNMKSRCYNKKNVAYKNYGGRGITFCDEWLKDRNTFCEWALKNGYDESLTIDRIDNNKGYSPDNCRWATIAQQNRNTRLTKITMQLAKEIRSSSLTCKEMAQKLGLLEGYIYDVRGNRTWVEDKLSGGAN